MSKKNNWVNYKELKSRVDFKMILERYGIFKDLKKSGKNYVGICPIHGGSNKKQFSVNIEGGKYNCFGDCQEGGNFIDFVSKMENVSFHNAALLIQEWFLHTNDEETKEKPVNNSKNIEKESIQSAKTNTPLTFKLKKLNKKHQFFKDRGISSKAIDNFELGFCNKGLMKDYIVIPIHNMNNELVAYCGRAVTEEQIEEFGKYKLPPKFNKSLEVYNLNRIQKDSEYLIIVESYLSVFRLFDAGIKNVIALMGSSLSEEQIKLIIKKVDEKTKIILLFDDDESGNKCTLECLEKLGKYFFVKSISPGPFAIKPHQLSYEELNKKIP